MSSTAYSPMPRQTYIAREGYPFVAIALLALLFLLFAGLGWASLIMVPVVAFVAFFFRNPERKTPLSTGLIVAPADGRVLSVENGVVSPVCGHLATRVSIFMSVFDVHINRLPVSARVRRVIYTAGKFFVASLNKASQENERNTLVLEDDAGREFIVVQIAGIVARRIVCYLKEGDRGERGMRMGLIRFGSRVDLYLPPDAEVNISKGERVRAGESVIGRMP